MGITYVFEDTLDAVLERIDRTAAPGGSVKPSFICPFCKSAFPSAGARQSHVANQHRQERPVLFLNSQECPREVKVRGRAMFALANVTDTAIEVDGQAWMKVDRSDLPLLLEGLRDRHVRVRLANGCQPNMMPTESEYRLDFRIADEQALIAIENAFEEHVLGRGMTKTNMRLFVEDARCSAIGKSYAEGLYLYTLGLLLKENPGEGQVTAFSEYPERLARAYEALRNFDRPLARLISTITSFMLNDLSALTGSSGFADLDIASDMLAGKSHSSPAEVRGVAPPRIPCPVDHGTSRMLEMAKRFANYDHWSDLIEEECREVSSSRNFDLRDRRKVLAFWAVTALRFRRKDKAQEPLTQIAGIYPFEKWAAGHMAGANA